MRVVEFSMDGITVKLASMTWAQAEKFVEQGQALIAKGAEAQPGEWLDRTLFTVQTSLSAANGSAESYAPQALKETYDMPTLNAMYFKILEISGLAVKQGEVKAA